MFVFVSVIAFGTDSRLKGLDNFFVDVGVSGVDDLSKSQVKTDAEVKLRVAGINIAEMFEEENTLIIKIIALNIPEYKAYVFSVTVEMQEWGYWKKYNTEDSIANKNGNVLWGRETVGMVAENNSRFIRDIAKDFVDEFLNDYLSVNPK